MSDKGRGWYGESERHAEAAKDGSTSRVRRAGSAIRSGVMLLLTLPLTGLGFLRRQAAGTWSNLGKAWDYATFDNLLPPSITSTIQWFIETIPKLLGLRDSEPWEQVGAAVTVIGVALLATVLSGGLLIGTVVVVGFFGLAGVVRLVPFVNEKWTDARAALPVKDDYDVPRWRRD